MNSLTLPFTTSRAQAARLARIDLMRRRDLGELSLMARLVAWFAVNWRLVLVLAVMTALALVALWPALAFAQAAAPALPSTAIDLGPLLSQLISGLFAPEGILTIVLVALANKARQWFNAKTGVDIALKEETIRAGVDKLLSLALKFAIEHTEDVNWTKIETRNALVASAANWFIAAAPGYIKQFGWTKERIEQMLLARLYDHDDEPGNWTGESKLAAPAAGDV